MLYCKNCGAEVGEDFRFCEKCFADLRPAGAVVDNRRLALDKAAEVVVAGGRFSPEAFVYDYDLSGCNIGGCRLTSKIGTYFGCDYYSAVDDEDLARKLMVRHYRFSERDFLDSYRIISGRNEDVPLGKIDEICTSARAEHSERCKRIGVRDIALSRRCYVSVDGTICHNFMVYEDVRPLFLALGSEITTIRGVVKLSIGICDLLMAFEQNYIVYNSVYESNIFVKGTEVFLGDESDRALQKNFIETPSAKGYSMYIPPKVDEYRSYGIYSLAVMLYRMFNGGRLPYMNYYNNESSYGDFIRAEQLRGAFAELQLPANAGNMLGKMITEIITGRDWADIRVSDVKSTLENALYRLSAEELDRKIF